ncbi:MAG: tol-pal system protein YbgF [Cyclobacteriaceae bacterium]|nr:tol-pal system protein YbgF [Cyclobacteriaceae bacterium]
MKYFLIFILVIIGYGAFSQEKDSLVILISDMQIQIECTQGLNDMYNFKFRKAESQFLWLRNKYTWHPLPYFLLGLNEWWKIMPDIRDESHDEKFLAYMDTVITISEELFKKPEHKIEAAFFLSAAYGFKGRLYSEEERKEWRKATVAGKEALNYLEVSKGRDDLSPELLFGDALYNYFSHWIPENYFLLKPVMLLFPPGDKELGLKQLREVSFNAFYTRTEAMVWLMRILLNYENDTAGAFYLGEYLYKTYPDNPYFHRYYARLLYSSGRYTQTLEESRIILNRIDSAQIGYEATSGRYAAFYAGHISQMRGDNTSAKKFFEKAIFFSESIEATDTGYYLYSLIKMGEIFEKEGKNKKAKEYYKKAKKMADRSHPANKAAKEHLKEL